MTAFFEMHFYFFTNLQFISFEIFFKNVLHKEKVLSKEVALVGMQDSSIAVCKFSKVANLVSCGNNDGAISR